MTIGERIKEVRMKRGISTYAIEKVEPRISHVSVEKWECGKHEPSVYSLLLLAKVLDSSPNELLGWDDE